MTMLWPRARKAAAVAGLVALPIATHILLSGHRPGWLVAALIALQCALIAGACASLAAPGRRTPRVLAAGLAILATILVWRGTANGLQLAAALPQALAYLGLLAVFAASLAPGREAVITLVARRVRGTLTDRLVAYTRRVTLVWCCFFAGQVALSAALFLWAPRPVWSAFATFATLPAVAAMFAAELAWRHVHHGIHAAGPGPGPGTGSSIGRWRHALQVLGQIRAPARRAEP